MHILMLSYDKNFFAEKPTGDVLPRHIGYSEHLDRLDIVVFESVGRQQLEMKVSPKLAIYPSHGSKILCWLRAYLKARKICRENKADIVVTQDPLIAILGVLLKKEFGCKLFINVLGLEMFSERWLKGSILHRLYRLGIRWSLQKADLVRTETGRGKAYLMERFRIPKDKVVSILVTPSPESITKLIRANGNEVRTSLLGDRYERIVLFVGRLVDVKNIPNFLRASRRVISAYPETLFAIVGDGPERKRLEDLCQELGVENNVKFLGALPHDDIPAYYAACDVFVLPSWSEGFGRVMMEAAFAKKPIVATNVGGAEDIVIENETGYIVEIDNAKQMADRLQRMLANPQRARQMGNNGYKLAMNLLDPEENTRKLIATWKTMLESGREVDNALVDY